jgi:ribosome-associated translation inhibitor RaiA
MSPPGRPKGKYTEVPSTEVARRAHLLTSFMPYPETPMQVMLNTDPHTDGRQEMAEHLESVVKEALGRFGEHITRVEAHLSDANSHAKASPDAIHCTLEARLAGLEPVVVKDHAGTAHQAINGAVGKLKRAVATVLEKHDPRHNTAFSATAEGEETLAATPTTPQP